MVRCEERCPAERTLLAIGGRWKVLIVYHLAPGPTRFSELRRRMASVTPKMLTRQLREMEKDGLVRRRIFMEIPPRVEYSLTPLGRSLGPVIRAMCKWGRRAR